MSKLIKQYEYLKKRDFNKIYIFKVGAFYNILQEDARLVSTTIGLKLTNLGPNIIKCGFPISKLEKYTHLLTTKKIPFEIISNPTSSSQNTSENIINKIKSIDLDNTTFHEAFNILYSMQKKLNNIPE